MSLAGITKWRPRIDDKGVLRPTNDEMWHEVSLAQRDFLLLRALVLPVLFLLAFIFLL